MGHLSIGRFNFNNKDPDSLCEHLESLMQSRQTLLRLFTRRAVADLAEEGCFDQGTQGGWQTDKNKNRKKQTKTIIS